MKPILWPMIWKEWRENARWATLALIALSLALGYQLYAANLNTSSDPASGLWNGVAPVFLFGCPLLGAALGFAQVMPELRRDQWAYLVHRPVPRTTLFWGKTVTGLSLALGATALPLGLLGLWAALPGDVAAPFDVHLLLPGVAALLTIAPFYFAGMLLALRPARWYGSRPLPLAAAVLAAALTRSLPEFWMAALAALVFGAVLCLAAWGCFATKGEYAPLPRPARAGLGLTLYAGSGAAVLTLVGLMVAFVSNLTSQPYQEPNGTFYMINGRGQVLIGHSSMGASSATDLQGHPVTLRKGPLENNTDFDGQDSFPLTPAPYPYSGKRVDISYTDASRLIEPVLNNYRGAVTSEGRVILWYSFASERRVVGYVQKTRQVFGYVGPTGFSPASYPNATRFEASYPAPSPNYGTDANLLRYPRAVYWLNIAAHPVPTITTLYTAHTPGEIVGACQVQGILDPRGQRAPSASLAAVAAAGQFFVYTSDGRQLFALPREYNPARYTNVSLTVTPDGQKYFFWYSPSRDAQKAAGGRLPQYITETTKTGRVTRRYTLPPLPAPPNTPPDARFGFFGLLAPPLMSLSADGIFHKALYEDPASVPGLNLTLAMSLLSGIISAGLMGLISRRCGDSRRVQMFWGVAGLPLGLFGVLMLLALRPWPGRVPCPNCGRPRDVDRDVCPHCGAGFPRPARDGTEIFEGEGAGEAEQAAV